MRRTSAAADQLRRLRVAVVLGLSATLMPIFLLARGPSLARAGAPWAAGLTAWWLLPLVGFLWLVRSRLVLCAGTLLYVIVAAVGIIDRLYLAPPPSRPRWPEE